MITNFLILSFLLGLQVTLSHQKTYINKTLNFINEPVPQGDRFLKCKIALTNSSTQDSSFVGSKLKSKYTFDQRSSFFNGAINKTNGNAENVKYELMVFQSRSVSFRQSQFLTGAALFNNSLLQDMFINYTIGAAQNQSVLEQVFVNSSFYGATESLIKNSKIQYSIFVFVIGNIENTTITYAQALFSSCNLTKVTFYNSSVCLEPTVKLEQVSFINSTVTRPKKCSLGYKDVESQVRELSRKETLQEVINEDFNQNILRAVQGLDKDDQNEDTDEENKIEYLEQHFEYVDLLEGNLE